jgi:DNA (cytosine-5)-methyltransferase 1
MKQAADLFCGAGGTTTGLLRAAQGAGVQVDMLAVNHWNLAIESHLANHPDVRHLCESLDGVDPRKVIPGGKLDYLAASPECTNHSIARGGMPCSDQSRASAWHVARWAEAVRPEYIVVENVREFRDWGPLTKKGRPDQRKKGRTFAAFLNAIESLGYRVDHQLLNAADFGDATTRTRLFIQAWRKGSPTWPEASHQGQWKPAREVIDWDLEGASIFGRKRALSTNTMRRIMAGLRKFSGLAFTMPIDHLGSKDAGARSVELPISTITTEARHAVAMPWLVELRGTKAEQLEKSGKSIETPLSTITTSGAHHGLCEPYLVKFHGIHAGRDEEAAFAARCHGVDQPMKTIDTSNRFGLVEPFVIGQQSCAAPRSVEEPMPTIATRGAVALAEPFLTKFYGTGGARPVTEPLDTITTKDRFGLCLPTVEIGGETYLVDVKFRMLQPHELMAAMGFPADYQFAGNKGERVKQIGNAVAVGTSAALFANIMKNRR